MSEKTPEVKNKKQKKPSAEVAGEQSGAKSTNIFLIKCDDGYELSVQVGAKTNALELIRNILAHRSTNDDAMLYCSHLQTQDLYLSIKDGQRRLSLSADTNILGIVKSIQSSGTNALAPELHCSGIFPKIRENIWRDISDHQKAQLVLMEAGE